MPDMHNNVLNWASILEPEARLTAERVARLPFVDGHVALMADAHVGKGSTVGSVIPTKGAIMPAAVGVDIGCGMIAAQMPFTSDHLGEDLTELHKRIGMVVPSGVGKGHGSGSRRGMGLPSSKALPKTLVDDASRRFSYKQQEKLIDQFGSLGGGNHFIEVCLDENDIVWVVLHSGSRGIGNELARVHIDGAKKLMKKLFIKLEDPDLAYLVEGSEEFKAYIADMRWAQEYALANREAMMDAVLRQMAGWVGHEFRETQRVNVHHNYTEQEHHNGRNMWITRKGAVRARLGDMSIMPGSMGTATYIVEGLGNPGSYNSAAHGAGRVMSRGQAKRELSQEEFAAAMEGIAWNEDTKGLLDEAPKSYKPVDQVMKDQGDLVQVKHSLVPVLNMKGY